jgi:hypothetical protein
LVAYIHLGGTELKAFESQLSDGNQLARRKVSRSDLRRPNHRSCPIEQTFTIVGKKWTVVILGELFFGADRFGRIKSGVGRITSRSCQTA